MTVFGCKYIIISCTTYTAAYKVNNVGISFFVVLNFHFFYGFSDGQDVNSNQE